MKSKKTEVTMDDFFRALGGIILSASAAESLFIGLFRLALLNPTDSIGAIWLQSKSSRARVSMVHDAYRAVSPISEGAPQVLKFQEEYLKHIHWRNFYCHAVCRERNDGRYEFCFYDSKKKGGPVTETVKVLGPAMLNEMRQGRDALTDLNERMWAFIASEQQRFLAIGLLREPIIELPERFRD